jgi:hypothetical protein
MSRMVFAPKRRLSFRGMSIRGRGYRLVPYSAALALVSNERAISAASGGRRTAVVVSLAQPARKMHKKANFRRPFPEKRL